MNQQNEFVQTDLQKCRTVLRVRSGLKAGACSRELDHIGNFNFVVEIEGVTAGHFNSLAGLSAETEAI